MKQLPNGIWVIEGDTDTSAMVEQHGRLDYDHALLDKVLPYIKPGSVVVDAGANIGCHTHAYLQAVGETGRVYAFEPNPDAFECLRRNCPKAYCLNAGVGSGSAIYSVRGNQMSGSTKLDWQLPHGGPCAVIIPIEAIHPNPSFVKIDVEGFEMDALLGMCWSGYRPTILIEINAETQTEDGFERGNIYAFLRAHCYTFRPLQEDCTLDSHYFDLICEPK